MYYHNELTETQSKILLEMVIEKINRKNRHRLLISLNITNNNDYVLYESKNNTILHQGSLKECALKLNNVMTTLNEIDAMRILLEKSDATIH